MEKVLFSICVIINAVMIIVLQFKSNLKSNHLPLGM